MVKKDDVGGQFEEDISYAASVRDSLLGCAKAYGTPLYCLDEKRLVQTNKELLNAFREAYPKTRAFYAFKCNDLPYLVHLLMEKGLMADVSCLFELKLAIETGFKKIIYTAPHKSLEELSLAARHNERVTVNIDRLNELERLSEITIKNGGNPTDVSFRLKPQGGVWHKFGMSYSEAQKAIEMTYDLPGVTWCGLHFHTSWNSNPKAHVENLSALGRFISKKIPTESSQGLRFIDVGGGFMPERQWGPSKEGAKPITSSPIAEFAKEISDALKKHVIEPNHLNKLMLYIEPGRISASDSTHILTRVVEVGDKHVVVDAGINMLGSDTFNIDYMPVINLSRPSKNIIRCDVYGPLCDPDDHFGNLVLGEDICVGDILAILYQGAYSFSTAWRWQRPTPAYASFFKDQTYMRKKPESYAQRYAGCVKKGL